MKVKLKWKVEPEPTGRYRSFEKRGWPSAYHPDGSCAAAIDCDVSYNKHVAANGKHPLLEVRIADHSQHCWEWKKLVRRAISLGEAKMIAEEVLNGHPEFWKNKYT